MCRHSTADQLRMGEPTHVTPQLAAKTPLHPGAAPGPTPSRATELHDASATPRSPGRPPHAQLQPGHEFPRRPEPPGGGPPTSTTTAISTWPWPTPAPI